MDSVTPIAMGYKLISFHTIMNIIPYSHDQSLMRVIAIHATHVDCSHSHSHTTVKGIHSMRVIMSEGLSMSGRVIHGANNPHSIAVVVDSLSECSTWNIISR